MIFSPRIWAPSVVLIRDYVNAITVITLPVAAYERDKLRVQ